MIVNKDNKTLRKKVLNNGQNKLCCICRKKITVEDVQDNNFEYVKNKIRRKLRTQ